MIDPQPVQNTREKILEAAIQVFARSGYHDTRIDDIVGAASTSKGAFYFYFPSKEHIFLALIDQFARMLAQETTKAIAKESEGIRRVDVALTSCVEIFGRYRPLAKIFLVQAAGLGLAFEQKRLEVLSQFAQIIKGYLDQAVAEGDIPPLDTEIAAMAWIGAINEVIIRWVLTGEPEPERTLPSLRMLLLRSIGVPDNKIPKLESPGVIGR